jgi:chromosome segregation ATPase
MKVKNLLIVLCFPMMAVAQQTQIVSPLQTQTPQKPAPQPKPVKEVSAEIKDLTAERDTLKVTFKQRTMENSKDVNHYKKIANNMKTEKEKYKSAKSAKKTEKMDAIQEKITADSDSLKELNIKIKADEKEISTMEKNLEKAEKALQKQKDLEAKAKGKK